MPPQGNGNNELVVLEEDPGAIFPNPPREQLVSI